MSEKIWSREEVPVEFTWKLEDLYETDEAWLADFDDIQKTVEELAPSYKGKLAQSAEILLDYFKKQDELELRLSRLANYAMRKSDQDATVAKYQGFVGKVMSFFANIGAMFAYAAPEIIAMDEETLTKFYEEKPELKLYKLALDRARRDKEHVLSEKEEAIMAAAGPLKNAPDTIYGMFENADIKFPNATDSTGKEYPLTNGSYIPLVQSEDRELRKSAFNNLYHTFEQF